MFVWALQLSPIESNFSWNEWIKTYNGPDEINVGSEIQVHSVVVFNQFLFHAGLSNQIVFSFFAMARRVLSEAVLRKVSKQNIYDVIRNYFTDKKTKAKCIFK